MGRIPQAFIDELIARADIAEIIGARVPLKKSGREYKACCPFHGEKTPSFWVSPEKQFYHCFGCGAHGTVLGFLMSYDRLSFPEAVEDLASRLGLEVPHEGGDASGPRRIDDDAFELMGKVARFYMEQLARDARASQYVRNRGLTSETLERFAIGYAPNAWNEVLRRFGGTEEARKQLAELGLIVERERGQAREGERHYDRFRDRIMFPIRDARGRVIAFGGRIIDQGEPKYLNSPETALFHKGRELYGLYETRQARVSLKRLLIVEGYMDTVRLHQSGIQYAVATLGTATTPEHLKRVFRLVSEVVFAFDGDRAGRAAAWRALQHALPEAREGRELRFLFLPEGHDPDSLVGEEGRDAFEARLAQALPLSEYFVRSLAEQVDLSHADGRARFAEAARPLLAKVPPGVYHELLLGRVAEAIKLPAQRLAELWNAGAKLSREAAEPAPSTAAPRGLPPRRQPGRAQTSAGRGSLVRQAVDRLLRFPQIAADVRPEERAGLDRVEEAGIDLLRELLDNLRTQPAQSSGQVIQRWADRPEQESLVKLLQKDDVITDSATAAGELRAALLKLAELADTRRFETLNARISQHGMDALNETERIEFTRLVTRRPARS
ncbi:MAG TPA: DNA primase [Steroidobacteraceae bacterium]|jgi:DNA primase|nr:DNA primase [Steroidobacteraceae bacterium]